MRRWTVRLAAAAILMAAADAGAAQAGDFPLAGQWRIVAIPGAGASTRRKPYRVEGAKAALLDERDEAIITLERSP